MANPSLPTLTKQPWESRLYDFNFRAPGVDDPLVPGDRTIASVDSVTVLASDPGGDTDLTISGSPTTDNDALVQARLEGGNDGQDYPIQIRVVDDQGNKIEGDAIMKVRDL